MTLTLSAVASMYRHAERQLTETRRRFNRLARIEKALKAGKEALDDGGELFTPHRLEEARNQMNRADAEFKKARERLNAVDKK
jgi:sRNA-binding protein